MTLIALCSLKGSPGVTTAALGLAARWPSGEQPVVVECDPAGGDLLARFRLETSPGLVSMAAAARRSTEPGLVWQHTQRLPGGLPVVVGPPGAVQACAALGEITGRQASALRRAADRAGTVVIADCGRIDTDSAAMAVLRAADVMVLLSHARDDALSHVATRLSTAVRWSTRPCFVLVGDGYPTAEVAASLDIPVMGRLPHDPKGAAVLGGENSRRSAPARSPLGRAMADLAAMIAYHARAEAIGWKGRGAPGYPPPATALGQQPGWASAPAGSPNGVPR
jgi:hypothetical protein